MANANHQSGIDVEIKEREAGVKGFVPVRKRWVVERTFGWLNRSRRLSKDYERTLSSSQAWIDVAMIRIGVARLCREPLELRQITS
jgi:putative transposase